MRSAAWIVVGCLVAGGAMAEDWVEVIRSHSGTIWQVDRDSIAPGHPGIQAWFRFTADHNLQPGGGADYRSGRSKRLFDCAGGRSADLFYDWYVLPNWEGPVASMEKEEPGHPHWMPPRPGSIEDALMAFVCDYASRAEPGKAAEPDKPARAPQPATPPKS